MSILVKLALTFLITFVVAGFGAKITGALEMDKSFWFFVATLVLSLISLVICGVVAIWGM